MTFRSMAFRSMAFREVTPAIDEEPRDPVRCHAESKPSERSARQRRMVEMAFAQMKRLGRRTRRDLCLPE